MKDLERIGPRPIYLVDGEERVLVDEAVRAIRAKVLATGPRDFNLDVYSAKEVAIPRIVDAALTLPVFAPFRLVHVKDADEIEGAEAERLVEYVDAPSPSTVLLLVANGKMDARTRLYKAIAKAGGAIRFEPPKAREMPAFVRERAKATGLEISDAAVTALAEAIGPDLAATIAALEQLGLYAMGRAITPADVELIVTHAKEESVFELSDAIGARDSARSLELVHAMVAVSREHPLRLLAMIARHWRRLLSTLAWSKAGMSSGEIAQRLGVPPFVGSKFVDQARRHTLGPLATGLQAIADADEALKGGHLEGARVLERLVLTLTGGADVDRGLATGLRDR